MTSMNSHLPAPESAPPAPHRNWTRRLVNLLVALAVVAVAAATFVFSYSGVHAVALLGGVSTQLARYYPGLFDAVLVIACVAAVMLREGRWWARLWAWFVLVLLLAATGITDVLHAMNYSLRPRLTEGIVAAAPVAAVLLAFSLLLTLLRQSRSHPQEEAGPGRAGPPAPATLEIPSLVAAAEATTLEIPAIAPSSQLRPPAPPIALPAAFTPPPPVAEAAVAMPAPEAETVPDVARDTAATREEPVVADAQDAEPPTVLTPAAAEVPAVPGALATPGDAPVEAVAAPETGDKEPGPGGASQTDQTEADGSAVTETAPSEPPTLPVPVPARTPTGIRYAGGAAPRAGRPDYWEAEEAGPYAGQVYPAHDEHEDAGGNGNGHDGHDGNGHDGEMGGGDSGSDQQPARRQAAELEDDAPPFATAPFAPVPRLNRVRSMPAPPAEDEE
jgi:hypothetical protein